MALVLAALVALTVATPAWAAGALTNDGTIKITGIDEGDTVTLYKIIKWDDGWKLNGTFGSLTVKDLTINDDNTDGITLDEATTIASNVTAAMIVTGQQDVAVGNNGEYSTTVDPGMYLALITDVNNDTVYNPVFVSSDWDQENDTNVIDASQALGAAPNSVAKKEDLVLNKDIDTERVTDQDTDKKTVAPGDVVPFKVTVNVPTYADNYTNPTFVITDTLSGDVTMTQAQQNAISVSVAGMNVINKTADVSENQDQWDYEIVNVTGKGYTVSFSEKFLKSVHGNPLVTITYDATVDELEDGATLDNVERYRNEVTLTFSNSPTDANSHGTRDDETNHYTFSIDASLNGENAGEERTKELVKVGVDEGGNEVQAWTTSDTTKWSEITPIEGAVFKLVNNTTHAEYTATSDENGYLSFYGLDAGTYTLTEESAPAGYIKDGTSHEVVITPHFTEITDTVDGTKHEVLDSYTVTVDGNESSYTVTNASDSYTITEVECGEANITTPFTNFKGTELPSTGGMGTRILYTIGGAMIVAGGIYLVAKRRLSAME